MAEPKVSGFEISGAAALFLFAVFVVHVGLRTIFRALF